MESLPMNQPVSTVSSAHNFGCGPRSATRVRREPDRSCSGAHCWALLVWLLKRDDAPEIDDQGKESLNFQISMLIYTVLLGFVCFVLMFVLIGFLLIPLFGVLYLLNIVLVIIASIKASEGKLYRYPLTIRLINQRPVRAASSYSPRPRAIPFLSVFRGPSGFSENGGRA